jgi:hypothetical protein
VLEIWNFRFRDIDAIWLNSRWFNRICYSILQRQNSFYSH